VGQGIREGGVPLFITTKVWNADQVYESTLKALVHLYNEGRVRTIGVSMLMSIKIPHF
jgi:diketogulonate reductase-like aldo/keto reductase